MNNANKPPVKDVLDGLPLHLQQALLIAASVLRRMSDKRLDKPAEDSLIDSVPKGCGGDNDD